MPRIKGRFKSKKATERALMSSTRLKSWHEGKKEHSSVDPSQGQLHQEVISDSLDSDAPNISETVTIDQQLDNALPSGRRIVELSHIANQLQSCIHCRSELNMINTVREDRYGFGSVLTLMCRNCGNMNKIDTNKRHRHEGCERGPKSFVINTKAAIGMVHSGIGLTHINNFMSAMELPSIHHKTLKKVESKVGKHIVSVAKASCKKALQDEEEEIAKSLCTEHAAANSDGTWITDDGTDVTLSTHEATDVNLSTDYPTDVSFSDRDPPDDIELKQQDVHVDDTQTIHGTPRASQAGCAVTADGDGSFIDVHVDDTQTIHGTPRASQAGCAVTADGDGSFIDVHVDDTQTIHGTPRASQAGCAVTADGNGSFIDVHVDDTQTIHGTPRASQAGCAVTADGDGSFIEECCAETSFHSDHTYQKDPNKNRLSGQFKYDMGWQKRGSGRCYDSRSGVGTMIGNLKGKICAYGVRSKSCKKCDYHTAKGNVVPDHKCNRNWTGSSKAMEPDVAGQLVKEIENQNVDVGVLIMDDDCTTLARVRKDLSHSVEKWSDQNHTVKHIGNSLYALQKKHKCMSGMVIKHIQKCFNYALAQNKSDVQNFTLALKQIMPHLFGEHENCGAWCGYNKSPDTYKHRGLPYGKPLTGAALRSDLDAVINVVIQNAVKIAPGASTKDVESFNCMVAAKAPKRCHYSGSDSLYIRTSCTVALKTVGASYVNDVNKSLGISPGKLLGDHTNKQNKLRKRKLIVTNSIEFKRRKLEKKSKLRVENARREIHEGPTYQSGIAAGKDIDVTEIPSPDCLPEIEKVKSDDLEGVNKILCDIETTSLHKDADITQIAAVCKEKSFNCYILPTTSLHKDADITQIAAVCKEKSVNCYILPTKDIAPKAAEVTGLSVHGSSLFYKGKKMDTHTLQGALEMFVSFLEQHQPCVLVVHNFLRFDFPRIIRAFELTLTVQPLLKYALGIADTLTLFKATHKGLEKYSQEYLVSHFIKDQYSAHNALDDVISLEKLCSTVGVTDFELSEHSCTVQSAIDKEKHQYESIKNSETFSELVSNNILSKGMADKISKSGLCLCHLQLAVKRAGLEGLKHLMSEPT